MSREEKIVCTILIIFFVVPLTIASIVRMFYFDAYEAVYDLGKEIFVTKENLSEENLKRYKTDGFACFVGKKIMDKLF